jgi:hypothetical protein
MGQSKPPPSAGGLAIVGDGDDVFIVLNGVLIAKRGHAGTPQAGRWISLEPEWSVVAFGDTELTVMFENVRIH